MAAPINIPVNVQTQNTSQLTRELQAALNKVRLNLGGNSRALSSLSQPLGRLTGQADEFSKSLDAANARVLAFGASVGIVNAFSNAFKSLVASTIEVEKAIKAIIVVGDQFNGKTKQLSQGLFNVAKVTGQSFAEVSKAALEFSRQGLGVEDTLQRTQDALILTRLTGLDAAKAVEGLTAAVNGFSKAGLTTTQVLNKLAAVDQAFAVSSADLIEGFNRSAAVAENAGVTFDELAGIITSLQQQTSRGGAVIGNALKTIFTRLQDTSTLNQLQGLGIAVQDLEGNLLPARQILQNLAKDVEGLGQITRAGIFKDVAGTFQINQLIALVSDLGKQNSIAAAATQKAAGATNEAFVANQKLNQSLDAILNKVAVTGKQLGSLIGEIGLSDSFKSILDSINGFLEGAANLLQGDDLGGKFAKGIIKGIGAVLTGPGLGIFLAVIAKLTLDLVKFGNQSVKTFFGIGKAARDQQLVQESIVQTLLRNQSVLNTILSTQGGQNAQAQAFLGILNQQEDALQKIRTLAGGIAAPLIGAGYGVGSQGGLQRRGRAAGGYLPAQEAADVRRGVGGASPSSKVVAIPNFAFGGGKRGTMIANTSEYIVPNYAGGGSAIFNQDMVKTMGLPPSAKKIGAAGGFIPNFAAMPSKPYAADVSGRIKTSSQKQKVTDSARDYALIVNDPIKPTLRYFPTKNADKQYLALVAGIDPEKMMQDAKGGVFKNSRFTSEALVKKYTDLAIKDAEEYSSAVVGKPISPVSIKKLSNPGVASGLVGAIFENGITAALKDPEMIKAQAERIPNAPFDFIQGENSTADLNKFFGINRKIKYVEAKYSLTSGTAESFGDKIHKQIERSVGIAEERVLGLSDREKLKAKWITYRNRKNPKEGLSNSEINNIAEQLNITSRNRQTMLSQIDKALGIGSAAGGYIPNFAASALQQAIAREKSAGLSSSQIYVDQSSALKSPSNPMGLMVANTRDEPGGGFQGIARARREGANPKLYGAANGFVPNFVSGTGIARTYNIAPAVASGNNPTPEVAKGFADLAGKLIIAQSAMTFLSAASAEVGGKFEQLVTGLSQAIGSIVQFGFLLQGTKLGEKITDSFKGLLNKIPGVGRVAGAAQAGSGLLGRVGGGIAKFAGAAAGPLGLAVGAGFLVKGLADAFKTFNRKDLSASFDRLSASASKAAANLDEAGKEVATFQTKQGETLGVFGRSSQFLQNILFDVAKLNTGKENIQFSAVGADQASLQKVINNLVTANVAAGTADSRGATAAFLQRIGTPDGVIGEEYDINFEEAKTIEALVAEYERLAIISEGVRKKKDFALAQQFAKEKTDEASKSLNLNKVAVEALRVQYAKLKDGILQIDIEAAFQKFTNKTLLDLNSGLSESAKSVEEFKNSLKEVDIDLDVDKVKLIGAELEKINTDITSALRGVGVTVNQEQINAISGLQEAIAKGDTSKLEELTKSLVGLGDSNLRASIETLEKLKDQTQDLDRQAKLKKAQLNLDFAAKTLTDQQTLNIEKQNSILEKRLGLIEKEFEFKQKTTDLDRQISDARFETGLIGKSKTATLTAQRGRVAETQKRADQDVIRELQQRLVDSIKSIEIPTTLSPEAQQTLKFQRNASIENILQEPSGANPQDQINNLTKIGSGLAQGLVANIADQEQKASNYAFEQTIEAANGFANIIIASASDFANKLSSSQQAAINALQLPVLQKELEKAKRDQNRALENDRGTFEQQMAGITAANKKVSDLESQIKAIQTPEAATAAEAAKAEVKARVEKLKADKKAADAASAAAEAARADAEAKQAGALAAKGLTLNQVLATKSAKEFGQSLLELGSSFTILRNLVRDYIEGLPSELANLQFAALQSTSPDDLASNLIKQDVINSVGSNESLSREQQTILIAEQTALREKQYEISIAESATRRRELEYELQYLERFLELKKEGATVEELAAERRRQIDEQRTFGRGFERGLDGVQDSIDNYRSELGQEIPRLFSQNLAQGLNDAITGAKSLKEALTDAATSFFQAITQKNIENLANIFTFGGGKAAQSIFPGLASGGMIKGGSGAKDDVPAMLMGGEYVMKKSAVNKYGSSFFDALNNGKIKGFANGGGVQSGAGGFYVPGEYGTGGIRGKRKLLSFATQSFTGGQYDSAGGFGMSGASVSLEPESMRLSQIGRQNNPMFERVQETKQQAFDLYLQQLKQESQYQDQLKQMEEAQKAREKQLTTSIVSAVVSSIASVGAKAFTAGGTNALGAAKDLAAKTGQSLGVFGKIGTFLKGGFGTGGATGQGGLMNLGSGNALNNLSALGKPQYNYGSNNNLLGVTSGNTTYLSPSYFKRASGGMVYGGSGMRDDVPAMLTGGEFVLNNRATRKLGVQNLNRLNAGETGGEDRSGAITESLLSKLDELIQATRESSGDNVVVNVNSSESGGGNEQSVAGNEKELQRKIRQAVLDVIAQEKRLGGSLNKDK